MTEVRLKNPLRQHTSDVGMTAAGSIETNFYGDEADNTWPLYPAEPPIDKINKLAANENGMPETWVRLHR